MWTSAVPTFALISIAGMTDDPAPVIVGQRQVRIHRIVVGDRDGGKPGLRRQLNELSWRLETV